jgi:hypothetical protein
MEKVFLIKHTNNGHNQIAVQIPPHEALIDTYLNHMYAAHTTVIVVDKSKVPHAVWHRAFEDFDDQGNIEIDMQRAKRIFMQKFRFKRNKALLKLDQDYCKAFDNKNQAKMDEIEVTKRMLRFLPSTVNVDLAQTVIDLEKMWPSEILGIFGEI